VLSIADRVGKRLSKKPGAVFIQKHCHELCRFVSPAEDPTAAEAQPSGIDAPGTY
jgi:hypothetical protein